MTSDHLRDIFNQAVELTGADRTEYLDEACGADDALRAEVESLLQHYASEATVQDDTTNAPAGTYQQGDTIGPYAILSTLGEGGMGMVYLAQQAKPVRRRVALKVIKAGMDSKQVIARFEAEQQALALMDHPGIAKVFDAGATPDGRPYFVMEYVKGEPFNEFCDNQKLNTTQRLELFARVCDAIQHAHQKGVIHRDLKPSNILVAIGEHDEPEPKVIDFGIAKATSQQLTEHTIFTQHGQLIGTPEYMSPEQADMRAVDIDIRTDVYSLGVILYELLSGRLPFDLKTLREKGLAEIQRVIREDDPPKPSTRLTTIEVEEGTKIAKARKTQLDALANMLKKELEWIPLRALKKERRERYGSAETLAQDVRRYLVGEPLEAGPDSRAYRLKKYARRNKGPVIASALIVLILITASVISLVLLVEADRQRAAAELERIKTKSALVQANHLAYVANIMAAKAELETNDPAAAKRRLGTARTILGNPPAEEMPFEWKALSSFDESTIVFNPATYNCALSTDGTRCAVVVDNNTIDIFDTASGLKLSNLVFADTELVTSPTFSADRKRLVASCSTNEDKYGISDWTFRIWDIENNDELAEFPGPTDYLGPSPIAILSPDGTRLAVGGLGSRNVNIIDIQSSATRTFFANERGSTNFAFSPDGTHLAFVAHLEIHIVDIQTGERVAPLKGHEDTIYHVAYSPDGTHLASCGADATIRIWDSQTGDKIETLRGHEDIIFDVAYSPDGTHLASCSKDKTIRIWDAQSGETIATLRGHLEDPTELAFKPEGKQIISRGHRSVRRWDCGFFNSHTSMRLTRNLVNRLRAIAFSPDGARLALCGDSGIFIWDTQKREIIANLRVHEESNLQSGDQPSITASSSKNVAYSPDGTHLASCGADGTIRIWDAQTGENSATLRGHEDIIYDVAYSPDGTRLASCGKDKTIRIWDAQSGENIATLRGHEDIIYDVAYSPDGTRLASSGADGTIRIWDAQTGENSATLRGHEDIIYDVAYSPDGTRLASCGKDKTIRIWDAQSGENIATLRGHEDIISDVAYSPDGTRLASCGADNTIRIWDHQSGELLATFKSESTIYIFDIEFSPDGNQIAYADGGIRFWDTRSRSLVYQDGLLARQRSTRLSPNVDTWIEKSEGDKTLVQAMLDRGTKDHTPEEVSMLRNLVLMNLAEQQYGPDNDSLKRQAMELCDQGSFEEAERYLREIIKKRRAYWKDGDFETLWCINMLGYALFEQDKHEESIACFAETEEAYRRRGSGDNPYLIYSIRMLGGNKLRQGKYDEAMEYYTEALESQLIRNNPGELNELAWTLATTLTSEYFTTVSDDVLRAAQHACELTDYENAKYLDTLARVHFERGELADALKWEEVAVEQIGEGVNEASCLEALARYRAALARKAEDTEEPAASVAPSVP